MNYELTVEKAKELITAKLSHNMGRNVFIRS